jgi:NAD(P)-dependent dehydrogenase (short-subunit alcohol dehydrogenase family)
MGLLDGKVAIVTGSGGGIGREHALALAKEGAKVVVNDLGGDRSGGGADSMMATKVAEEIKALGGEAAANFDSVADRAGAEGILKTALDNFGRIDILINNAGILRDRTMLKLDDDAWDLVIAVHLKGTFLCSQVCIAQMKEQGEGGVVINTSSMSGLQGNFGQSNYGAAKAGIAGFTRVVAMETAKLNIRVNAIAPVAKTRMTEDLPMFQGVGDALDPAHISPMVVYLASDLSKGVTGKIFDIRGAHLAQWVQKCTKGVSKKEGFWTPQEIADSIKEITAE